jgi:hypothetical protein
MRSPPQKRMRVQKTPYTPSTPTPTPIPTSTSTPTQNLTTTSTISTLEDMNNMWGSDHEGKENNNPNTTQPRKEIQTSQQIMTPPQQSVPLPQQSHTATKDITDTLTEQCDQLSQNQKTLQLFMEMQMKLTKELIYRVKKLEQGIREENVNLEDVRNGIAEIEADSITKKAIEIAKDKYYEVSISVFCFHFHSTFSICSFSYYSCSFKPTTYREQCYR